MCRLRRRRCERRNDEFRKLIWKIVAEASRRTNACIDVDGAQRCIHLRHKIEVAKTRLCPPFDESFPPLIEQLEAGLVVDLVVPPSRVGRRVASVARPKEGMPSSLHRLAKR
jgi:hypothetical protein